MVNPGKPHTGDFSLPTRSALLRNVVENAAVPTFVAKATGDLVYANRAFCDLLGYESEECIGLRVGQIVHPDDVASARSEIAKIVNGTSRAYRAERRYLSKNGDAIWVLASVSALPNVQGQPSYLTVQAIDIDRQKRAEAALAESEERWNFALESAGQGVWDLDLATGREFHSRMWKEMRGLDPDEEIHESREAWLMRVHPEDRDRVIYETTQQDSGNGDYMTSSYRERHKEGHWISILSRGKAVTWFPNGRPARVIGTDTDVTSLKKVEEDLQFANTLLTTEMETSPDGILVVDSNFRIISFNRRFADMWGIAIDLSKTKHDAPVLTVVASAMRDPRAFAARVRHLCEHPEEQGHDELEAIDGRIFEVHTSVLRAAAGQNLGRVWFFRDITERKLADAKILQAARVDMLTGLANRAVFMEAVEQVIDVARRDRRGFAVLYLDLDQFKDVNDTLGHPAGDQLLKTVAERLEANTRAADIIARFGGDEFAVLAPDIGKPTDAALLADKLIQAMSRSFVVQGNDIRSSISIGIAVSGSDRPDAETILSRADLALYQAKAQGPGGYCFFTETMATDVKSRVILDTELREAIPSEQLFLVYQPQVEIATRRIKGVEALVRWRHPKRGVLGPKEFIPAAEKSGFITNVDRWVLRQACRQAKTWLDAGIDLDMVAVNLSAVSFKRSFELEREIAAALAETGLLPPMLELELTETVLMAAAREHNDVLMRLRKSGVRLAIDDFGIGYSSLDYLRRFPVDRIKIAHAFVEQIATEPGSAAIVKATIGLARELGVDVIAEGIESSAQLELLETWGCREGQGYYFVRPLEADDLGPLLTKRILPTKRRSVRTAA